MFAIAINDKIHVIKQDIICCPYSECTECITTTYFCKLNEPGD
jgi:hypothetical protein